MVGTLRTRMSPSLMSCFAAPCPLGSQPGSTCLMAGSGLRSYASNAPCSSWRCRASRADGHNRCSRSRPSRRRGVSIRKVAWPTKVSRTSSLARLARWMGRRYCAISGRHPGSSDCARAGEAASRPMPRRAVTIPANALERLIGNSASQSQWDELRQKPGRWKSRGITPVAFVTGEPRRLRLAVRLATYAADFPKAPADQSESGVSHAYVPSVHLPYARPLEDLSGRQEGPREHPPLLLPGRQDRRARRQRRRQVDAAQDHGRHRQGMDRRGLGRGGRARRLPAAGTAARSRR